MHSVQILNCRFIFDLHYSPSKSRCICILIGLFFIASIEAYIATAKVILSVMTTTKHDDNKAFHFEPKTITETRLKLQHYFCAALQE